MNQTEQDELSHSNTTNRALVGMAKEFTVGAIYKRHDEFTNYDMVILMNETTNSDIFQTFLTPKEQKSYYETREHHISLIKDN